MIANLLFVATAILAVIIGRRVFNSAPILPALKRSMDPITLWWLNTNQTEWQYQRVRVQERKCQEAARTATRWDTIDGRAKR